MKTLFSMLIGLLIFQVLVIWTVEDLTLFESVWITMTTVSTVGYGDYAPQTWMGRLSTIVVLFIGAITVLTLIISDFIEYRFYRRERILRGLWVYKMKEHIVIINTPQHGGSALAYIDDGEVICQPPIKEPIKGKGLIVLVRSSDTPGLDVVKEALERYRTFLEKWRNSQESDSTDS